MTKIGDCILCSNFYQNKHGYRCAAFNKKIIPFDIWRGEFDHTKKHPDQDNDILFEAIEEKK